MSKSATDPMRETFAWRELTAEAQSRLLEHIAAGSERELRATISEAEPVRFTCGGPRLMHRRTGLRFVLVPGGVHRLGRTSEARQVELEPFLLAETPLSIADAARLFGFQPDPARSVVPGEFAPIFLLPDEVERVIEPTGALGPLRLPTDDEWEAAYRAGTSGTFFWGEVRPEAPPALMHPLGLAMMGFYDEVNADGWVRGGAARLWPWDKGGVGHEWVWLMSAARRRWEAEHEPRDVAVRFALSIAIDR